MSVRRDLSIQAAIEDLGIGVDLDQIPGAREMLRDGDRELHRLRSRQNVHAMQPGALNREEAGPFVAHAGRCARGVARVDEELERALAIQRGGDLVERRGTELALVHAADRHQQPARPRARIGKRGVTAGKTHHTARQEFTSDAGDGRGSCFTHK